MYADGNTWHVDGSYGIGEAFQRDKRRFNMFFYGYLGLKAGNAWLQATGNWQQAIANGLYAAVRWKFWFGNLLVWCLVALIPYGGLLGTVLDIMGTSGTVEASMPQRSAGVLTVTMVFGIALAAFVTFFGLLSVGATYVYAVDLSLFKQRWAYRMLYPVAWKVRNVHWAILHTLTLVPIVVMGILLAINS